MIPEVGTTAKFTFTLRFATLDGIYRIRAETTFTDAIQSNIDFVNMLYIPAGLSQSDWNTDYATYKNDRVVVLESVLNTNTIYYVPESVFLGIPDPTIQEYYRLILVTDLGVQQNTQVIRPLLDSIKDLVQSTLGSSDPVRILTNPQNKIYLTQAEYQTLDQARKANAQTLLPLSVQLKQEQDKNAQLAARCAVYEMLLEQLAQQTPLP